MKLQLLIDKLSGMEPAWRDAEVLIQLPNGNYAPLGSCCSIMHTDEGEFIECADLDPEDVGEALVLLDLPVEALD